MTLRSSTVEYSETGTSWGALKLLAVETTLTSVGPGATRVVERRAVKTVQDQQPTEPLEAESGQPLKVYNDRPAFDLQGLLGDVFEVSSSR
jgi:hypothetical protein